ncbi:MAG: DEAD/DEAH box helicase [Candidatus Aenigmarchaeota archaeon]|nr:DEAD/DEAH box helicase [Candidatus Aenigmarchaeota archaeon]
MKLEDLNIPDPIISAIRKTGVEALNPPQVAAVKHGLLEGKNLVVASPTASGKTLIAELAIIKKFLANEKSVYLVPLKALASEKYDDMQEKYKSIGMRIALSTSDFDNQEEWLGNYDLVILSNEKMDSLLRRNAKWINDIRLIVIDEIHMLNDVSRGPTLEVVLTKLMNITNSQVLALSATIKNSDEMAKWLKAKLVESDYRPIKLSRGVLYPEQDNYTVEFADKKYKIDQKYDGEIAACIDTLNKGKQALVFVGTRRSAESAAEKISKQINKLLSNDDKMALKPLAEEIESVLSNPTRQCRRLANIVKEGVAFHHAGLIAKQRKLIEDAFKAGVIKFIVATPTLSFGVNLPAFRVLIRDVKRFDSSYYGSYFIPNFEVCQMMGRAGRPKYDSEGEAILLAKSVREAQDLKERYIDGDIEPIYSKLSTEQALRMHTLALIASESVRTKSELKTFFSQTFFAHQYKDMEEVMNKVEKILEELRSYSFIQYGDDEKFLGDFRPAFSLTADIKLKATRIGKRVAELYVDPLSAKLIIDNIDANNDLGYLTVINQCMEMRPTLRVKKGDDLAPGKMGIKIPDVWDMEYEDFLSAFKTSLLLKDWTNEIGEDKLLEKYDVAPGELYNKTLNAEWMVYSARELAFLLNKKEIANKLNKLRIRIKYGVKEELLELVMLRTIGRARARLLFTNKIRTISGVKAAKKEKLESILGKKIAQNIIDEVTQDREEKFRRIKNKG